MTPITWANCQVMLGELQPWTDNPRLSTKAQARRLLESWQRFGQVQTIAIGPAGQVYDGHQRLSALLTLHGKTYQVFNHYAPVAERVVPTAGRDPYTIALVDYVDRFGDAERVRLADIISMYNPGYTPFQKTNGKQVAPNTMPYSAENLPQTVAKLDTQISMMAKTLEDNQQRLTKISDALLPMAAFEIEDWFKVRETVETVRKSVESLTQQGRVLLTVFVAGTILTLVVLGLLVVRHVV